MNTKDFIKSLADKLGISQKDAARILQHTTEIIRESVSAGNNLTIQNLGNFQLKKIDSRESFIPALGKKALVPPKRSIQFHPSETLKENLKKAGSI